MGLFVVVNTFTASAWLELHPLASSICLTKSRGEGSGDVDREAAVAPQRRCLHHIMSRRAPNTVVGSVSAQPPSASSFLSVLPFCPFPRRWHPAPCSANSPRFFPMPAPWEGCWDALLGQPEVDFQVFSPNSLGSPGVPIAHDPIHGEPHSMG